MAMAIELPPPPTSLSPPPPASNPQHLLTTQSHHSLHHLRQIHAQLIKQRHSNGSYTAGALVKHYSNPDHRSFHTALKVFDQVPQPHVFLYNSIIRACVDNRSPRQAISFYSLMVTQGSVPNKYTFPLLFKACAAAGALEEATQLHAHVAKRGLGSDRYVTSAGIRMYAAIGMMREARRMLRTGEGLDPVCWSAMIDGCVKNGELEAARELFDEMPCKEVSSRNAMISGYARHGMIEESRRLFDEMPERDDVSWSAMMDGYVQCGRSTDALATFRRMLSEGVAPTRFVFSTVLAACANVGALEQGRWIHAYIRRNSVQIDAVLGTSLIDMYAKSGHVDLALDVFEDMPRKEVFTWNAMIGGLAMHGHARFSIELFDRMQREEFVPNSITFVGVLNACVHAGLVEEAYKYFHSMEQDYGVTPMVEHYGCMVDLLGRAGRLTEAEELIASMPMKPNAAVWGALLGGCKIHGNVKLGERVGRILLEMEPENSGRYALLSNIYARAGRWDDVANVRKLMKERGIKTIPGSSSIELDGVVHEFVVGDGSHPNAKDIHSMLKEILDKLRLEGYVPNISQVLFNIDEEEKESALRYHSEKLAIAFGLIKMTPGTTIRIIKNLRVCEDCHYAIKLVSQVYCREIVVRDRVRYHHFRDGICSCMEFW